jgi:hypothetical protein
MAEARKGWLLLALVLGGVSPARGESPSPVWNPFVARQPSPRASAVLATPAPAPTPPALLAEIELRPSWNSTDGHFFSQSYAELGLRRGARFSISYQQQVIGEISQYAMANPEPALRTYDGYLRVRVNDVYVDRTTDTHFSYEARVYAPTDRDKAAQGMCTAIRNYFKFSHNVSPAVTVMFSEVPILHVYSSDSGTSPPEPGAAPAFGASPLFENQAYVEVDWSIPHTRWVLSFPVEVSVTRYRDAGAGVPSSAAWAPWVEIYPELDFVVNRNLTLGAAYESGNIINAQTNTDPSQNPEVGSGTAMAVVRATF